MRPVPPEPGALRRLGWRAQDYRYVVARQAAGLRPRRSVPPVAASAEEGAAPVVLVPGVYESWTFLRPLGAVLAAAGHRVHVLPTLGYNRGPVPDAARALRALVAAEQLSGVVVVAHSKGGLVGKLAMTADADGSLAGMVAIATPFAGSRYARWVPLRAVRAFVPTDAVLVALAAERAVNARIVSVYSCFDPHIPECCALEGAAANIELTTPGHFRLLADPRLPGVVLEQVARLAVRPTPGSPAAG